MLWLDDDTNDICNAHGLGMAKPVGPDPLQVNLGLALRSRALELCWRQAGRSIKVWKKMTVTLWLT
jgi:hypothetical protein